MILDQAVVSRKCYQANKGRSSSSHDVYNQDPVLLTVKALCIQNAVQWRTKYMGLFKNNVQSDRIIY